MEKGDKDMTTKMTMFTYFLGGFFLHSHKLPEDKNDSLFSHIFVPEQLKKYVKKDTQRCHVFQCL